LFAPRQHTEQWLESPLFSDVEGKFGLEKLNEINKRIVIMFNV
jgi:hypothetical protein